jgi:hypothetical protein
MIKEIENYDELHRKHTEMEATHHALHGELHELHEENGALRAELNDKDDQIASMRAYIEQMERDKEGITPGDDNKIGESVLIGKDNLDKIYNELIDLSKLLNISKMGDLFLNSKGRRRLMGAGERRWGFIEKTFDMTQGKNSVYYPRYSSVNDFGKLISEIELLFNITELADNIHRICMDHYLVLSNAAYNVARMLYRNVREAANGNDPIAQAIFKDLRTYYEKMGRTRRENEEEPTEKQIMTDVKALLHGSKKGEVKVVNEVGKVTEGEKKFIDNTHKAKERNAFEDKIVVND